MENVFASQLPEGQINSCRAPLWFLKENELYSTVKPYRLRFASPNPSVPRSNIVFQQAENVTIYDVRRVGPLDYNRTGIGFIELQSRLKYDDCEDRSLVEELYLKDLKPALCKFFGTPYVVILDHTTRRREQSFPISTGEDYDANQPVMVAHIDWTEAEVEAKILASLGKERGERVLAGHYQFVHVWKPLNGPIKDWPLAFCDSSSVEPRTDLEPSDSVNDDENYNAEETYQVYFRSKYRWFYLSDQKPNELAIFRQHDSILGPGSGVPHSAFPDPSATAEEVPRESIELQVIVYWDS